MAEVGGRRAAGGVGGSVWLPEYFHPVASSFAKFVGAFAGRVLVATDDSSIATQIKATWFPLRRRGKSGSVRISHEAGWRRLG